MIDRYTPPPYKIVKEVSLPPIEKTHLKSGSPLFFIANTQLKVFRLELVFRAGSLAGEHKTDSYFTSLLLNSGTSKLTSTQVTESFEHLGAQLSCSQGFEYFTIRLLGLSSFFEKSLDLLKTVLLEAAFPENELEIAKNKQIQAYQIGLEKADVVCNQNFRKSMFGQNNPYSVHIVDNDIKNVSQKQLIVFYEKYIQHAGFASYLVGNISTTQKLYFEKEFNFEAIFSKEKSLIQAPVLPIFEERVLKEKAVQCSIKLGNRSIGRNDNDYAKFLVSNVLFGGFFGSRLMKNIREEKGLTYGISSSASPIGPNWVWSINSAVKKENIDIVLEEIQKELNLLQSTPPDDSELETVKNYISGSILSGLNTVFDIMDKHRIIEQESLFATYYEELLPAVHAVKKEEVSEMAATYMSNLSKTIVG
jgi:zinc protease